MTDTYASLTPEAIQALIAECGGPTKCAEILGVSRMSVWNWAHGGRRMFQRHVDAIRAHLRGECPHCGKPLALPDAEGR